MKLANDALKIVTQEDLALAKKTAPRVDAVPGGEVDPDKLMELLGDIEGLKQEVGERMRRFEAVKQAKALILEDALRTEALNQRLTEFGKVMSAVNSGTLSADAGHLAAELQRALGRGVHAEAETLPVVNPVARPIVERAGAEAGALAFVQPEALGDVMDKAGSQKIGAELPRAGHGDLAAVAEAKAAVDAALKRLDEADHVRDLQMKKTDESAREAKRLLEESHARLIQVERLCKDSDTQFAETKKRLDQAALHLAEAKARSDAAEADLRSAQQEMTTAYQFASVAAQRRMDAAEFFRKAVRWAVFSAAFSWVAMIWAVWSSFRSHLPVYAPGIVMLLIIAAAVAAAKVGPAIE